MGASGAWAGHPLGRLWLSSLLFGRTFFERDDVVVTLYRSPAHPRMCAQVNEATDKPGVVTEMRALLHAVANETRVASLRKK